MIFAHHQSEESDEVFNTALVMNLTTCLSEILRLHAFILRVAELIDAKVSDSALESWLRVILTTMCVFEILETADARSARSDTLREVAVTNFNGIAWTVIQKVYHLGLFKARKERDMGSLAAEKVAALYNEDRQMTQTEWYFDF